jgi:hypothetical protein
MTKHVPLIIKYTAVSPNAQQTQAFTKAIETIYLVAELIYQRQWYRLQQILSMSIE